MQNLSCMVEIEHRLEGLTAAERRVAEFVYQNPQETVRMSVSELADCCSVAKSAVTRCCKSLGFAGYKEMKMSLAVDLSRRSGTFSSTIGPADSSEIVSIILFILNLIYANYQVLFSTTNEHIPQPLLPKFLSSCHIPSHW